MNKDSITSGKLIVYEGIDGTGKTTQIKLLTEKLLADNLEVVCTREPTDGQYGKKIRELYHSRENVSKEEELQLFMDDRREHVEKVIAPALAAGKIVITDRYYYSTAAYQGAAGMDPERIIADNEEFAPTPDIVFLLDIPVAVGIDRIENGRGENLNSFEQEEVLRKVAHIFNNLDKDYIVRIDGTASIEEVHAAIMTRVNKLLTA